MACIEPHVQREGLIGRLVLNELDSSVNNDFRLMAKGTISLGFVKWISADRLEFIKVLLSSKPSRHLCMPLAEVTGAVTVLTQQVGIKRFDGFGASQLGRGGRSIGAAGQPRQNRRTTDPANRVADKRIFKSCTTRCQFVQMRRLDDRVAVATQCACGLVVRKKENDVGAFGGIAAA